MTFFLKSFAQDTPTKNNPATAANPKGQNLAFIGHLRNDRNHQRRAGARKIAATAREPTTELAIGIQQLLGGALAISTSSPSPVGVSVCREGDQACRHSKS